MVKLSSEPTSSQESHYNVKLLVIQHPHWNGSTHIDHQVLLVPLFFWLFTFQFTFISYFISVSFKFISTWIYNDFKRVDLVIKYQHVNNWHYKILSVIKIHSIAVIKIHSIVVIICTSRFALAVKKSKCFNIKFCSSS